MRRVAVVLRSSWLRLKRTRFLLLPELMVQPQLRPDGYEYPVGASEMLWVLALLRVRLLAAEQTYWASPVKPSAVTALLLVKRTMADWPVLKTGVVGTTTLPEKVASTGEVVCTPLYTRTTSLVGSVTKVLKSTRTT